MWFKQLESCEATDTLVSKEMFGSAWATLRVAYECMFYSCAILVDPSKADRLGQHHMFQLAKLFRDHIKDAVPENSRTAEQLAELANYEQGIKQNRPWPAAEAAKDADLFGEYSTVFRTISQTGSHANISSLDHYISDMGNRLLMRGGRKQDKDLQLNLTIQCLEIGLNRHTSAKPI